jgi:hypothetical protein
MTCSCGRPLTLAERLLAWGRERHGLDGGFTKSSVAKYAVAFRVGPITGFGHTTNEAVNHCADGLVELGWPDDRQAAGT